MDQRDDPQTNPHDNHLPGDVCKPCGVGVNQSGHASEQPLGDELQRPVPGLDLGEILPAEIPRMRGRASSGTMTQWDIYRLCNTAAAQFGYIQKLEEQVRDLVRSSERYLYADLLSNPKMCATTRLVLRESMGDARKLVSGQPVEACNVDDLT